MYMYIIRKLSKVFRFSRLRILLVISFYNHCKISFSFSLPETQLKVTIFAKKKYKHQNSSRNKGHTHDNPFIPTVRHLDVIYLNHKLTFKCYIKLALRRKCRQIKYYMILNKFIYKKKLAFFDEISYCEKNCV